MFSIPRAQSAASSVFSTYGTIMLVKSMANEFVPRPVRSWLNYTFWCLLNPLSSTVKITVEELSGYIRNEVYDAAEIYLQTKTTPNTLRYTVTKTSKQDTINVAIGKGEALIDTYEGITLTWRFTAVETRRRINPENPNSESKFFVLTFHKKFKDRVFNEYLPYIMEKSKEIRDGKRALKIYTADPLASGRGSVWRSVNFIHPATFETLAMEPEMKTAIIDDLGRFVGRREYYKKVGKAWKRGYLLYGPPGTGKSSLIAAMANYLRFDIYDLDLTQFASNSNLRNALLSTTNKSIIVIEDIDCTVELKDRESPPVLPGKSSKVLGYHQKSDPTITLSGLLNLIDGLWSSCGDERIIIFTTNHKDKLDPALLRPGRMDMHIHMSYLTNSGFKLLAFNYLGLEHNDGNHQTTFDEIKNLIEEVEVTPAQVAEELMKSEDSDIALGGVVNFLKRKREEAAITSAKQEESEKLQEEKKDGEEEVKEPDTKKLKIHTNGRLGPTECGGLKIHSNGRLGLTPTECDGLGVVLIDG